MTLLWLQDVRDFGACRVHVGCILGACSVSRTRSASNETPRVAPRTDLGPTTPARDLRPGRAVWTSTPVALKYNGPSALGSAVSGRLPLWTFPIRTS